jgi:hypothetical protein
LRAPTVHSCRRNCGMQLPSSGSATVPQCDRVAYSQQVPYQPEIISLYGNFNGEHNLLSHYFDCLFNTFRF